MGCMNTKLAPETPKQTGQVVETVYPTGNGGKTGNRKNGNIVSKNNDNATRTRQYDPVERTSRKVARYRDRFDVRVTCKYDIKALIGKGSFSRVVRVEHLQTKQPYAIKVMDKIEGKEVFQSELNVLRRVRHAYIIQLFEVFETNDKIYMVMDLATGGELFDSIITKGSFTERDATRVLRMVLDGLQYLHNLGITHRDLKPENLLLYHPGPDSKILITDFGLSSCRKQQDGHMRTTCGTPEYIAPEVLYRNPYSSQVDMWAVGVITYIMLSGTMPFDDENRTRLYRQILKVNYSYTGEHWKDVSLMAKEFIDSLLKLDPLERMTAGKALKHKWLTTSAASSSNKNLQRTISKNLLERQSTRNSVKSAKSNRSTKSNRSVKSNRSEHRRVMPEEIEELHKDPEVQADILSIKGHSS